MTYVLKAGDLISGQEGTATAIIDGDIVELFMIKKFEAKFTKKKSEVRVIGQRGSQHKSSGWEGKGTVTTYYVTSEFRRMAQEFAKTGRDLYFTITVTNDDPNSSFGRQTVSFLNCNLDDTVLARLDVGAENLEDEFAFTFDDFDILEGFAAAQQ